MGLRYSSSDSQALVGRFEQHLRLVHQMMMHLTAGSRRLVSSLESGTLTGAAYKAGQGLFLEVIIPTIRAMEAAITDIEADLAVYRQADELVSAYGILDLDNLEQRIQRKQEQLSTVGAQLSMLHNFIAQASSLSATAGHLSRLTEQV